MLKLLRATLLLLLLFPAVPAPATAQTTGILLLAHGGRDTWNQEILSMAEQIDSTVPVEVAFGMANKRTLEDALDRLAERNISNVVAVPLFVSSHSSVMRATEYLLGSRGDAPPEMEAFGRMAARRHAAGGHAAGGEADDDFDWHAPIETTLPISLTSALDSHALVADILVSRAREVSQAPENEVVVVVAHGPSSEEDNARWLENMRILVDEMRPRSRFSRIKHLTVRDDAREPIWEKAAADFRAVVKAAAQEDKTVLIVPLLLSYGGIEVGIRERLEGLDYRMANQALLPDDRLAEWVLMQAMP